MNHVRILLLALAFVAVFYVVGGPMMPVVTAQPASDMPSLDFQQKAVVFSRWMSIFVEGKWAGWKRQTMSEVKFEKDKAFLFEETVAIRVRGASGVAERNIKHRALTTPQYHVIAFDTTDESTDWKVASSGYAERKAGTTGPVFTGKIIANREINGQKKQVTLSVGTTTVVNPDFAAVDIFRTTETLKDVTKPLDVLDTTRVEMKRENLVFNLKVQARIDGASKTVSQIIYGGIDADIYYLDGQTLLAVRSIAYPVSMRASSGENDAKSEGRKDADYQAEKALTGSEYRNEETGLAFKRPFDDWALKTTTEETNLSNVMFKGIAGPYRLLCWVVRSAPADADKKDAVKCLQYIARSRTLMVNYDLEMGAAEDDKAVGELKRFSGSVRHSEGSIKFEGRYYCFFLEDRAMILICLMPAEIFNDEQKAILSRFADTVALMPLQALPPVAFNSKDRRIILANLAPSWLLAENANGVVDVKNSWFAVQGNIIRIERTEKDTDDVLYQTLVSELSKQHYKVAPPTDTTVSGIKAKEVLATFSFLGVQVKMKVLLVLGTSNAYRIYLATPDDLYSYSSIEVKKFLDSLKLKD